MNVNKSIFILLCICLYVTGYGNASNQTQTKPTEPESAELRAQLDKWIDDLVDDDDVVYEKARWKLYKNREKAIPQLVAKLRGFDYDEFADENNEEAEDYFHKISYLMIDMWHTAHPAITELLKDDSLTLRAFALDVLSVNREVPADLASPILHSLDFDFSKYEFDEEEDETFGEYFIDMYVWEALRRVRIKGVKTLITALEDENKYIRYAAASVFDDKYIFTDEVKTKTFPIFIKALKDEYYQVRSCAISALGYMGDSSAVKSILPFLSDSNSYVQETAQYALRYLDCSTIIPDLIKLLDHDDLEIKSSVAQLLKTNGNATAIPALLKNLNIDNEWKRYLISSAIYELIDETSILCLVNAVKEQNAYTRAVALDCLIRLEYESIVPLALEYIEDENSEVRKYVARALGNFGNKSNIPVLLKLIKDKDIEVQGEAAWAIGGIGEKSDEIFIALREALKSEDDYVRMMTVRTINKVGDKTFILDIEAIIQSNKQNDRFNYDKMQYAALKTYVGLTGLKSIEFIRSYIRTEEFDHKNILRIMIELIDKIDDKTKTDDNPAIGFYAEVIANGSQYYITDLLNAIGDRKNQVILDALCFVLANSESRRKREEVSEKMIEYGDKSTLPTLIKGLNDINKKVRENCVQAISEIGDKSQVEILKPMFKDSDVYVRRQTIWAIAKLDGMNQYKHFIPMLDDESDEIIEEALEEIVRFADNADDILSEYFDTSEKIRGKLQVAEHFLSKIEKADDRKNFIGFIIKHISNENEEIQRSAIIASVKFKEKSAVPALLKILENDQNPNFRLVIESLGTLGDKSVAPKLINILEDNYNDSNRSQAALSLGMIGDSSVFDSLVNAMQCDIYGWVRASSARALGNLGAKRAIPYLIEALKDVYSGDGFHVNFDVQRNAVEALGKLKAKEALEPLKKLEQEYRWSNQPDKYCEYEYQLPMKRVYLAILKAIKQIQSTE